MASTTPLPGPWKGPDHPDPEIINQCVQCGLCLYTCPTYLLTYREPSSPRGRIQIMEAVSQGILQPTDKGFAHQMYECLDCRACEPVCPSGVKYGQLVEPARYQVERMRRHGPVDRTMRYVVFRRLFADMRLFRGFSRLMWLYQASGAQKLARGSGLLRLLRLARTENLLPKIDSRFFVPKGQVLPALGEQRYRVGMFAGCIMSTAFSGTDEATVRVLRRNGCEVVAPEGQGCCGALNVHGGELDSARSLMKANIEAFEREQLDYVIINAAGCGSTLKEYGHMFARDPDWRERAEAFASRVRDVNEFLASIELNTEMGPLDLTVTYQDACHLAHAQRISVQPRQLLMRIPGLKLVEMNESSVCCGSAGIYNITQPEFSQRLMNRKLDNALAVEPAVIVSSNPGCILQMRSGLRDRGSDVRVMHIIELLDEAYTEAEAAPAAARR